VSVAQHIKKLLSKQELDEIAAAIKNAETRTSGEIRVAIRQRRSRQEKGLSVEQVARREFVHLGMRNTEQRTGILIFVLVEAREFFILADEHINGKVAPASWNSAADAMAARFRGKEFKQGLLEAVQTVGDHLAVHFPPSPGDKNELSNEVELS
jgi:uncharacterized membrane protein